MLRKYQFSFFILIFFEACALCVLFSIGLTRPYHLYFGVILCTLICLIAIMLSRFDLRSIFPANGTKCRKMELAVVIAVLFMGMTARIWAIARFPIIPSSDFQTYYIIAELLSKNALSASEYSGYIAQFPHVIGYSFILSLIFRLTGPSLSAGLYFNVAAGILSVFLSYRIARLLGGRLCGLMVLIAGAFWPSQILYSALLASEPVFTCLLLLSVWLFIHLFRYPAATDNIEQSLFLCVVLGAFVALASAVRPMGFVVLAAFVICLAFRPVKFNINEKILYSKLRRASCQGWFRALAVLAVCLICMRLISASISDAIGYELPGAGSAFGFNLMVGVNIDSGGAWNRADAVFFGRIFAESDSAEAAHRAAISVAYRIKDNPSGVLALAMQKFVFMWGDDEYASSWIKFFVQQEMFTPESENLISNLTAVNNCFYFSAILFSAVYGLQLIKRSAQSSAHVLILLFLGAMGLHIVLETQNRYHYAILPIFMILGSLGITGIYHLCRKRIAPQNSVQSQSKAYPASAGKHIRYFVYTNR